MQFPAPRLCARCWLVTAHGYQTHVVSCWMLLVDDAISAKVVNPLLMPGCFGAAIYQSRCQAKLRALVVAGDKLGWFEAQLNWNPSMATPRDTTLEKCDRDFEFHFCLTCSSSISSKGVFQVLATPQKFQNQRQIQVMHCMPYVPVWIGHTSEPLPHDNQQIC